MGIEVHPVSEVIGAEVHGVDLAEPLTPEDKKVIEEALLDHMVLFFRDQHIDDEQHRNFAAQFGPVEPFVLAPPANPDVPEMHTLMFDSGATARGSNTDSWHTDGIFMEEPPLGTVLRAVELPAYGGDTCWANMYAVYDALSPAIQRALEGLVAEHDYMKISYTTFDDFEDPEAELRKLRERYPIARHPVVRTHPVTKRKVLYVTRNYTINIVGLTPRENEFLMPYLFDLVREPAFQCRFSWEPGSVAFWDNRSTQHYAIPDYPGRRMMNRVVIAGDRPF